MNHFDAVVIGGGFYGSMIAVYLAKTRGMQRVLLVEQEATLLSRASYHNQARIHNGYHYPRSFRTAFRSRQNLPKFVRDWAHCVRQDFTSVYAIAGQESKVTPNQFIRFCKEIGARATPGSVALRQLFNPRRVSGVFTVDEYVFDAEKLASSVTDELSSTGVAVMLGSTVKSLNKVTQGGMVALIVEGDTSVTVHTNYVINCAYSGINRVGGDFSGTHNALRHEITEMALVIPPPSLRGMAITVMDGPFFSLMPFPPRRLHTLSHVRYTPHQSWDDTSLSDGGGAGDDPYRRLAGYAKQTRFDRMIRDTARYLPSAVDTQYVESLFEVKTVLCRSEHNDGRPILFEKHVELPGCFSILGGKIDNIYDIIEKLDAESFDVC